MIWFARPFYHLPRLLPRILPRLLLFSGLFCTLFYSPISAASALTPAPAALHIHFDYAMAKISSKAVLDNTFDPATVAAICVRPEAAAIIRKLKLQGCDALVLHLKNLRKSQSTVAAASIVSTELAKADGGNYRTLAAQVSQQLEEYVPAQFAADLDVHFIFGSNSGGFAFDDVRDDVYVNLARLSDATAQELGELVAHELFHAVQAHVMQAESLPKASGPASATGPVWLEHLLFNLEQEGTAELFTHPVAERPTSAYSASRKREIEHNAPRIASVMTMFETMGWRLLYVPPADENAYDDIYDLMFTTDFGEPAYDLGWLMASTIAKQDGKQAIFALLKDKPARFVLRYQSIALADGKLPTFSADFIDEVKALH